MRLKLLVVLLHPHNHDWPSFVISAGNKSNTFGKLGRELVRYQMPNRNGVPPGQARPELLCCFLYIVTTRFEKSFHASIIAETFLLGRERPVFLH
jgi:hypothetical protein